MHRFTTRSRVGWPRRRGAGPLLRCAIAALAIAGLGACASAPLATLADDAPPPTAVDETLRQQRQVHRALAQHPAASAAKEDLALASEWLERAEDIAAGDRGDEGLLTLLLETIEGQHIMIKTFYDRRAAEEATGVVSAPISPPAAVRRER